MAKEKGGEGNGKGEKVRKEEKGGGNLEQGRRLAKAGPAKSNTAVFVARNTVLRG